MKINMLVTFRMNRLDNLLTKHDNLLNSLLIDSLYYSILYMLDFPLHILLLSHQGFSLPVPQIIPVSSSYLHKGNQCSSNYIPSLHN